MWQFALGILMLATGGVLVWFGGHLATEVWNKWQQPSSIEQITDQNRM